MARNKPCHVVPNQSSDCPCGPVQATGEPFHAIKKRPLAGEGGAILAMDGKTLAGSLLIHSAPVSFTVAANCSRADCGRTYPSTAV